MPKVNAISITPTTRNFPVGGGGNAIITSGSGTWTAAVSEPWLTLSATSGSVGTPVAYTVSATTNIGQRVGYVYVSGHVHTVTQDGYAADVSPTEITVEKGGKTGTITLDSPGRYAWDAHPNNDWISITPTHGVGSATLTYQVAPYAEVSTRSGTITVGDKTVTVFQYGSRMKLNRYSEKCDYLTHVIPITVNALAVTSWRVTPNASWISVVDAGNGQGGDTVSIAVGENPSWKARTGTVTIGTETFTVTQEGRTALEFRLNPTTATANVTGGNGVLAVNATPDLPWTAKSGANWLTIMSGYASGAGNGNVVYNASPNSTLNQRTGKITVTPGDALLTAKTLTVTQPAAVAAISKTAHEFPAAGGSVAVDVTVGGIVEWSVSESLSWLSVEGSTSRVGPGTVVLSAAANDTVYPRSGTLKIAGKTFTVSQKARGVELEYDSKVFGTDGGMESISIHPDGNASWTAVASDNWIVVFENASGTGDAEIIYILAPYEGDGSPRTGWITIGDKKVYITQRAYDVDITPRAEYVSGNSGAGEIGVAAKIGDVWQAIIEAPWIKIITGYDAGSGNGVVRFTYTENNTGLTRTGKIVIAGEVYTLTQAARIPVPITASVEGHGLVSGAGEYTLGDKVSLEALPEDGYEFLYWTGDCGESMQNPLPVTADVAKSVTAHFGPLKPEFTKTEVSTDGVKLTWRGLAWATQYKIYRAPTDVFPSVALVTLDAAKGTTWQDTTGDVGKTYFYWVEAIGADDTTECKDATSGAKQKPIVYSSITYTNLKGATHANPATYQEGTTVSFSNPSAVTGYTFTGWTPSAITATMTGAQAVMANWKANTYTIAYHANGGSGTMAGTAATYDQDATLTANGFTRTGFEFAGWATALGGEVTHAAGATVRNLTALQNGVVTLYAVWEEIATPGPDDPDPSSFKGVLGEDKLGDVAAEPAGDWIVVERADAKTGNVCVQSAAVEAYDEEPTEAVLRTSVTGPGTFTFWWKASCDADPDGSYTWDHGEFRVDGEVKARIDGMTDWQQVAVEITGAGPHTVAWVYVMDGYPPETEGTEDCILLDAVSWSGASAELPLVAPVITPADGSTFTTATCTVTLSCATAGATIYYSTNGRTPGTTETYRYKGPFTIDKTTTVKAVAVRGEEKSSYVSATITKEIPPTIRYTIVYCANGGTGEMSSVSCTQDVAVTLADCGFARSGYAFAGWATSATGPVAYAAGASVSNLGTADGEQVNLYAVWDYLPLVDPVISPADGATFNMDACEVTISCASVDVILYYSTNGRTPGTTETYRYKRPFTIDKTTTVKAVAVRGEEKSAYVSATITKEEVIADETQTTEVPIPYAWLKAKFPGVGNSAAALEAKALATAANGRKVWECYVAGEDPTDAQSRFKGVVAIVDGKVVVSWTPDLNTNGVARIYTVYGCTSLEKGDWETPAKPWHRFFKVTVTMPTGAAGERSAVVGEGFVPQPEPELGGVQLWENGPYWAECNVGATKPEEYGYYFWWGDTGGYVRNAGNNGWVSVKDGTSFSFWSSYCPTYVKSSSELQAAGYIDSTGNLVAKYDAATAHLGTPWRMPTDAEMSALESYCTTTWTTRNGVYGRLVTGKGAYASKSIFLPAAGDGCDSGLDDLGSGGGYWSSTPDSDLSDRAWDLGFVSGDFDRCSGFRYLGFPVRPLRGFAK